MYKSKIEAITILQDLLIDIDEQPVMQNNLLSIIADD